MKLLSHTKTHLIPTSIFVFAITLSGCGGGSDSKSPTTSSSASSTSSAVVSSSSSSSSSFSSSSSSLIDNTDSAVSVIRDQGGLFFYTADSGDITSSALIGTADEVYARYEDDALVTKSKNVNDWIALGPNGWTPATHSKKVASFNTDGSVTTQNNLPGDVTQTLNVKEVVDLSGLNILDFMESNSNTNGMVGTLKPTATFASGAKGYKLNIKAPDPVYSLYYTAGDADGKCWGGESLASASGGNCVSLSMTENNNTLKPAASGYSNIFSTDVEPNQTGYRAIVIGNGGPNKVEAQIINDAQKTVRFYLNAPSPTMFTKLIGTSTWSEVTLPYLTTDNKAVHFTIPQSVYDENINLWLDNKEVYIAQQNGYLRNLYASPAGTSTNENISFNATANADIVAAQINYVSPLVGTWKLGGDIFVFSDNNTFSHFKTANDDENCRIGLATGTYSWSPKTAELSVKITSDSTAAEAEYSCSIGGKLKFTLSENTISFNGDGEQYTFTKFTNASNSILGTWILKNPSGNVILTFSDTHYFLADHDKNADDDADTGGHSGIEDGTYTYNGGNINVQTITDTDGTGGFSSGTVWPITLSGDGNSFTTGDGADTVVLKRFK